MIASLLKRCYHGARSSYGDSVRLRIGKDRPLQLMLVGLLVLIFYRRCSLERSNLFAPTYDDIRPDEEEVPRRQRLAPNAATATEEGKATPTPRLCSVEQIKYGAWRPLTLPKAPYIPKPKGDSICYSMEMLTGANWSTYEWIPTSATVWDDGSSIDNDKYDPEEPACEWTRWDEGLFCDVFRNKTITVIGDSLTWEHYSALANAFGHTIGWKEQVSTNLGKRAVVRTACNGTVSLAGRKMSEPENVVKRSVGHNFPDVIVMNFGAHYVEDTKFSSKIRQMMDEVQQWQAECRLKGKANCLFIWRTTVPGHPNCRDFKEPATSIEDMEALVANRSLYNSLGKNAANFNWWLFKHQNELAMKLIQEAASSSPFPILYDFMPAYEINILRPDAHHARKKKGTLDCLHSCEPGSKATVYNQILLHLFRLRAL